MEAQPDFYNRIESAAIASPEKKRCPQSGRAKNFGQAKR
jgi:hypothetical protein